MTESEDKIITQVEECSRNAERAYWWMRNVDPDEAQRLGVSEKSRICTLATAKGGQYHH